MEILGLLFTIATGCKSDADERAKRNVSAKVYSLLCITTFAATIWSMGA